MNESRGLEAMRLWVILGTIALSVATVVFLFDRPWSDGRTAAALSVVNLGMLVAHVVRFRDHVMARLLVFGAGLGLVELAADALCVRCTGTLDYSATHTPFLALSPFWMPAAWTVVAAQIGYLGSRLICRFGAGWGMALTAGLGALNIPFYEEMAYHAHWWRYDRCLRVGHTPVYIVVSEMIIALTLGPLAARAMRAGSTWRDAAVAGMVGGLSTIWGGLIGYGLVERVF